MRCFMLGILLLCITYNLIFVDGAEAIKRDGVGISLGEEMSIRVRPSIEIYLEKEGFHRDLSYVVNFEHDYKECDFTIEQKLPDAVYVDTDQLSEWARHRHLNISYPSMVDIEKTTEKAKPFYILMHSQIQHKNITVPIHYRYHAAGYHKFKRVEIDSPTLYVSCLNLPATNNTLDNNTKCFDKAETLLYKCNWKQVHYSEMERHRLKVHIPVGDKTLGQFFLCLTTIVSWACCLTILYSTNRKMKILSKKLI